jgi:hypothetical protein
MAEVLLREVQAPERVDEEQKAPSYVYKCEI